MVKTIRLVVGGLLVVVGAVWVGQGVGWIEGSFMTGEAVWAVIGAVCVVAGLFVVAVALRSRT
jgi:uncharacterized membrane protein YcjF (UPF0283 family)